MTIEQTRAQVVASVWQAVAQSGVDLSAVPQEQQEKLVGKIADSVMVTMNGFLDDVVKTQPVVEVEQQGDEKELWRGRPFMSVVETYVITTQRVKVVKGMLSRDVENYELIRIKDLDMKQGLGERMLGIGDIKIKGSDASSADVVLRNVSKPEEVYEILRKAWLEARKNYGLQFRDYV